MIVRNYFRLTFITFYCLCYCSVSQTLFASFRGNIVGMDVDLNTLAAPVKKSMHDNHCSGDLVLIKDDFHHTVYQGGKVTALFRVKNNNKKEPRDFSLCIQLKSFKGTLIHELSEAGYRVGSGMSSIFNFSSSIPEYKVKKIKQLGATIYQKTEKKEEPDNAFCRFFRNHKYKAVIVSCLLSICCICISIYISKEKKNHEKNIKPN